VVEKAAVRELDELDKTKKYSCQLEFDPTYSSALTQYGFSICVFDVKKMRGSPVVVLVPAL
jgi:hypothetical protein